jgi:hypothetical protein
MRARWLQSLLPVPDIAEELIAAFDPHEPTTEPT